jgi:hypothetical protein
MRFMIEDGAANIDSWPVNSKGTNLSLVGNQAGGFEAFAYGSRILNLVLQYNRLGLYPDSLELLNRSYPTVAPEGGSSTNEQAKS